MTFRGRQLNTEPLFVSLASLKQKMSNIRSPEFLKPIAGEHLFKRDRDEPMTFPTENVEQMRREDIFREAPRDRSLTGMFEESLRTGKEKKAYEEMFIQKYPEKYAQLGMKDVTGHRGLQEAVKKGIITEEEASMFPTTEIMPVFSGMGIIKGMTKPLAQQILKVSKKATEKQIDVAFKKALHNPEVKDILRGLTKESGAKEMDLLTGARDILLKGVSKVKETVKLLEPVGKELEPLAKEAQKYKSAGEFQKALDIRYEDSWKGSKHKTADKLLETFKNYQFHGTVNVKDIKTQGFQKGEYYNSGVYFARLPSRAIEYVKQQRGTGKDKGVFMANLDKLKIKKIPYDEYRGINKGFSGEELVSSLKRKGYDGIQSNEETLVWNVDKIKNLPTIKDFYTQATKEVKLTEKPFTGLPDLSRNELYKLEDLVHIDNLLNKGYKYKEVPSIFKSSVKFGEKQGLVNLDIKSNKLNLKFTENQLREAQNVLSKMLEKKEGIEFVNKIKKLKPTEKGYEYKKAISPYMLSWTESGGINYETQLEGGRQTVDIDIKSLVVLLDKEKELNPIGYKKYCEAGLIHLFNKKSGELSKKSFEQLLKEYQKIPEQIPIYRLGTESSFKKNTLNFSLDKNVVEDMSKANVGTIKKFMINKKDIDFPILDEFLGADDFEVIVKNWKNKIIK